MKWTRGKGDGWESGEWWIHKSFGRMGTESWMLRRNGSRVARFSRLKDAKAHADHIEMGGEA